MKLDPKTRLRYVGGIWSCDNSFLRGSPDVFIALSGRFVSNVGLVRCLVTIYGNGLRSKDVHTLRIRRLMNFVFF
jgi:hypothetical protein